MRWRIKAKRASKDATPDQQHATVTDVNNNPMMQAPSMGSTGPLDLSDRRETRQRFIEAVAFLQQAIKWWKRDNESCPEFPELAGEAEAFDLDFREKLDKVLDSRRELLKNTKWADVITGLFTAFSPFAKNFLSVAIQGQSVLGQYNLSLT